jgi:hypothetical protein
MMVWLVDGSCNVNNSISDDELVMVVTRLLAAW